MSCFEGLLGTYVFMEISNSSHSNKQSGLKSRALKLTFFILKIQQKLKVSKNSMSLFRVAEVTLNVGKQQTEL